MKREIQEAEEKKKEEEEKEKPKKTKEEQMQDEIEEQLREFREQKRKERQAEPRASKEKVRSKPEKKEPDEKVTDKEDNQVQIVIIKKKRPKVDSEMNQNDSVVEGETAVDVRNSEESKSDREKQRHEGDVASQPNAKTAPPVTNKQVCCVC